MPHSETVPTGGVIINWLVRYFFWLPLMMIPWVIEGWDGQYAQEDPLVTRAWLVFIMVIGVSVSVVAAVAAWREHIRIKRYEQTRRDEAELGPMLHQTFAERAGDVPKRK